MRNKDFERAAKALVGTTKGIIMESAKRASTNLAEGLTEAEGTIELLNSKRLVKQQILIWKYCFQIWH